MNNFYQTSGGRSLEIERRLGLVAGFALLWVVACGPEPEEIELDNLVAGFASAEVSRERPMLDLGAPAARPSLGAGWSWDGRSEDGTTFVWVEGTRAEVEVFLARSRELEIQTRCLPFSFPDAPTQTLSFAWDGHPVAETTLTGGFSEFAFRLPPDLATAGEHRLTLSGSFAQEVREVLSSDDPRSLSFACDWIRVGDEPEPEPELETEAPRGQGDTLWIPAGVEVAYFLEPTADVELSWQQLSERRVGNGGEHGAVGPGALSIVWQVEGAEPEIFEVTREGEGAVTLGFPADAEARKPARLGLRVSMPTGSGGVVLKGPRVSSLSAADASAPPNSTGAVDGSVVDASDPGELADPPPILIWVVDTLRADRLGHYGHDRPTSPHFDALAARSTVFEQALAQSSWTRPTMATLLTGVGPERHGIRGVEDGLSSTFETLAERFRGVGYATGGFSTNGNFSPDTHLDQGFERFEYRAEDAGQMTERLLAWLDELEAEEQKRPPLMVVLTTEPHASFEPTEPFRSRFAPRVDDPWLGTTEHIRALGDKKAPATDEVVDQLLQLYDAEIAWNDQVFGALRASLAERGMDPLIVVVADHGEAFRERGVFGHGWDLHREVLHIPFWIHLPGQEHGARIADPVQQADLVPTLLEWVTGQEIAGLDGQSLVRLLDTEVDPKGGSPEGLSERSLVSTMDYEGRAGASLVRGRYKLIEPLSADFASERLLFDLQSDPEETHNLSSERPILAGRLARLLKEFLAAQATVQAEEVELDPETREQLEALGYLG